MQTEFTCGIYTAKINAYKWRLETNQHTIAIIDPGGLHLKFTDQPVLLSTTDMLEILVIMEGIKRQYKQLRTTQ